MLLDGLYEDFDTGDLYLPERNGQRRALFATDAAGPPVGDVATCVKCAKIASNRHVIVFEFEADTCCLQGSTSNLVFQRVIAKKSQVTWTASRGDSRLDRNACTLNSPNG